MKKFLAELEDNFCGMILLVMTILTCINVFARYVFRSSMPFVEELTSLGLVIISLTGAAVAAKRGAHLGLTLLTDFLPKKAQKACIILGHILGIVFGAIMLYYGVLMARQEFVLGQKTAGMQWPEWLFGMFIPISGAVLLIRYGQLAITTWMKKEDEE
ncbi:MAG: TRAP transporter small permease [Lachnospiraceae bacterium]|nr:TRAP transporter small permease [Lachnospiraceae bacterium]